MKKDIRNQAMGMAIPLIKKWEGFREHAYKCPAGIWTIGWGNTTINGARVKEGDSISKEVAEGILHNTVALIMDVALSKIGYPYLSPHQLAAIVSFIFNVGQAAFATSTLLQCINRGDVGEAYRQFARWNKARVKGKVVELTGLTNRRLDEAALFIGNVAVLGKSAPTSKQSSPQKPTTAREIALNPDVLENPEGPDGEALV